MKWLLSFLFFPALAFSQVNIDSLVQSEMQANHIPGASVVIIRDTGVAWSNNYGYARLSDSLPVTDNTLFQLASVTKVFTGTALMQLVEKGLIQLDDDIAPWLPFAINNPWNASDTITFRRLLTHTSCIKDNWGILQSHYTIGDCTMALDTFLFRYLNSAGADYSTSNFYSNPVGSVYHYSTVGVALLGYLVERVSGSKFNLYCKSNIFDKICMPNSGFFLSEVDTTKLAVPYDYNGSSYVNYSFYGYPDYPSGLLRTSAKELANFVIAYARKGNFWTNKLLDTTSVNQMLSLQIPSISSTQGLIWYQYPYPGYTIWGHDGADNGYTTLLVYLPAEKLGFVLLSNGEADLTNMSVGILNYALALSASAVVPACALTLGVNENKQEHYNTIFPNPATDDIIVQGEGEKTIIIRDALGNTVKHLVTENKNVKISSLSAGIYHVTVTGPKYSYTRKLIKASW